MIRYLTLLILIGSSIAIAADPGDFNRYFINAARKARTSVVNIIIYNRSGSSQKAEYHKTAYASGTIISRKGYIVTNYHVVSKGNFYRVKLSNGQLYDIQPFKNGAWFLSDQKTDIALMQCNFDNDSGVGPIDFANSNDLEQGEWVLAIGNPYGLNLSITSGIVSSKGRDNIGFADIEDFIQSDVPINPGNSGGPLVNLYGKLVGINTAIRTETGGYQGISFAIPSNIVKQVCSELMQHGRVRRGWLGFIVRERPRPDGRDFSAVEIISVIHNSPAEKAGLKKGDIIREIDQQKVRTIGRVLKLIGNKPVHSDVVLTISRDGKLKTFKLVLLEKRKYNRRRKALDELFKIYGIEIDKNSINDDVVISYISPRSISLGLKTGDVIIKVNNKKIFSIDDFFNVFYANNRKIFSMQVYRDYGLRNIDLTKK